MRDTQRPEPTRDLDTPDEIAEMVRRFYADVAQDDVLGPMFHDVARVDWSEHLPRPAGHYAGTRVPWTAMSFSADRSRRDSSHLRVSDHR